MENKSIHCTLTDAELAAKADQWIDELIASGGKSFTMQVPARPNKDTDLIFAELNNRFKILVQENERLKAKLSTYHGIKERCDKMEAALKQFISYHETGLLPDIFTYKKAVETLKQGGSNTPASVQGEKEVDNEQ